MNFKKSALRVTDTLPTLKDVPFTVALTQTGTGKTFGKTFTALGCYQVQRGALHVATKSPSELKLGAFSRIQMQLQFS
jgi:hypothetical protein